MNKNDDSQQPSLGKNGSQMDALVLEKILAAHNVIFTLPSNSSIAEYFAESLLLVPGVSGCRVCLEAVTVERDMVNPESCSACLLARQASREQPVDPTFASHFDCQLAEQAGIHVIPVAMPIHHFGYFVMQVSEPQTFTLYEPLIDNVASVVALTLKNRLQSEWLQQAHRELEQKVDERTQDLLAANRHLLAEIEVREQADKALRESEERYRMLVEQATDGIFVIDAQGKYIDVNPRGCQMLGFTRDEILKMNMRDLVSVRSQAQTPLWFDELDLGKSIISERYVMTKSGALIPVEISGKALDNGNYLGIVRDITERKQAEVQLRASEQLFRALVENSPDFIARYDLEFRRVYINPAIQKLFGLPPGSVLGQTPATHSPLYAPQIYIEHMQRVVETATENTVEMPFRTAQGEMHWGHMRFVPEFGSDGQVVSVLAIGRDIHEIKENEQSFRRLARNFPDFVARFDRNGRFTYVNPALGTALGAVPEAIIGRTLNGLPLFGQLEQSDYILTLIHRAFNEGVSNELEIYDDIGAGGRAFEIRLVPEKDAADNIIGVLVIARDITERKQAETDRQAHLHFLASMDRVNRAVQSTYDLSQMMSTVLDELLEIFGCDRAWLVYPCDPGSATWSTPMERTRPEYPGVLPLAKDLPLDPAGAEVFRILLDSDGPVKFGPGLDHPVAPEMTQWFSIQSYIAMVLYPKIGSPWSFGLHQCSYTRKWSMEDERLFQEIGRRISDALTSLLAYRNLQESEERYHRLVELSPDAIGIHTGGEFVFVNSAMIHLSGASEPEDLIGKNVLAFIHPDRHDVARQAMKEMMASGKPSPLVEEKFLRVDGTNCDIEVASVPFHYKGEIQVQIVARDITERKQHEAEREAIITVSNALRRATTRVEILTVFLDQLLHLFAADGAILVSPSPLTGDIVVEMGRGEIGKRFKGVRLPSGHGMSGWVIAHQQPYLHNQVDTDPRFFRSDLLMGAYCVIAVPLLAKEQAFGALWIARRTRFLEQDLRLFNAIADIAANALHRVTLFEQTESRLHHLVALHQIDIAIATNFDLDMTLKVILNNVRVELGVDAASILLLAPVTQTLEYAADIGFRTRTIEQLRLKLGSGHAGKAALEYRTVVCPDLTQCPSDLGCAALIAAEELASHFVAPLIVKEQVKGVLEVFRREPFEPDPDWLAYFETMATQTAIAIENASLFKNLQRSNAELRLAYDATIEGWSRALDLRDKETEGHTSRVTEMALRLADRLGLSDNDQLNLRRGALLHDIGKMGVPDGILLKPGPLTDEDWNIMRLHPVYAYEMLKPIDYLKPAIDIPYCHHERWDGSGYPRGLKGEAIPIAARVFAVIDVFDALSVDRPYRRAWPREDVLAYLKEQAGKQFDPVIVEAFLQLGLDSCV